MRNFWTINKEKIILLLIILLGAFFRFYNLNWDQNQHLHPDERFLTMVGNTMKVPENIFLYINPQQSSMNPTNIGFNFFVYGIFPLTLNKIIAVIASNNNYNNFTSQGRLLSGFFDLLVVFFVYKTVKLLQERFNLRHSLKYIASFFYTISVLPIQLSHFFAVDTFLNFFTFSSFYFALKFYFKQRILFFLISAFLVGLAISTKVSGIFILPLNLFLIILPYIKEKLSLKSLKTVGILFSYFVVLYFSTRIFDPYLFKNSNFFDLSINPSFYESIKSLSYLAGKDAWFPPSIQWINKPTILFSLYNIVLFGIGLPSFIFSLVGAYYIVKSRKVILILIGAWVLFFFFYQSTRFIQTMRYFIILYPFLAIFAGFGFWYLTKKISLFSKLIFLAIFLLWPLMFLSIYIKDHSRIEASKWIYENIENNSIILSEYWDDALPLSIEQNIAKTYNTQQLPVFDPDTPEKWEQMTQFLQNADYLILSSNRGWGSIISAAERYPLMSKFYKDLFAGKLDYIKIKEFTSYPSLNYLGIPLTIIDDIAEENFTVYDHPKVMIFEKTQ